jgi:hypothetical protein
VYHKGLSFIIFFFIDVSQSAVVLIEGAMKPIASKSKQIDGIYSQATCDEDRSCVTEFSLTEGISHLFR